MCQLQIQDDHKSSDGFIRDYCDGALHTLYFRYEEVVWSLFSTMMMWRFVIPWALVDANIRLVSETTISSGELTL